MSYTYNNTPVISKVTLPSGTEYYIKDSEARTKINDLDSRVSSLSGVSGMKYLGISLTRVVDGDTGSVNINGSTVYPNELSAGSVVIYQEQEFIWNGTKWQLFGPVNQTFGDLASADTTTATYTPVGTVSQPTFTGSSSVVVLTKSNSTSTNALDYTPAGTISAITVSKSSGGSSDTIKNPTTINNVLSAINTSAPSSTTISNAIAYCSVSNQTLSFNQLGTSSTASIVTTDVSVRTGDAEYAASTPQFTGTKVYFNGSCTPSGTVSQPTFTGTQATITGSPTTT